METRLSSNERRKVTTETRIVLFLRAHPHSRYVEIQRGTGISNPTLSARLKEMRGDQDGPIILEDARYSLNDKYNGELTIKLLERMNWAAARAAFFRPALRSLSSPESMIEVALEQLVQDLALTLRDALEDQDHTDSYLMIHFGLMTRLTSELVLALQDTLGGKEAALKVFNDWNTEKSKQREDRRKRLSSGLPESMGPLREALLRSYAKQAATRDTLILDSWFHEILEGGEPRKLFEKELGRKVTYDELTAFGKAALGISYATRPRFR